MSSKSKALVPHLEQCSNLPKHYWFSRKFTAYYCNFLF